MRTAGDAADLRARKQYVGAFKQTARIRESNRQRIIGFPAFTDSTELDDQRSERGQSDENERTDLCFNASFAFAHLSSSHSA